MSISEETKEGLCSDSEPGRYAPGSDSGRCAPGSKSGPGPDRRPYFAEGQMRPTVLLVEDDKALRRYLELTLVNAGYEVILAADGLEGMKMALTSNADIIVTDAMMPHLSGHEFCRFLKNSPNLSQIPIVMLSGSEPQQAGLDNDLVDVFLSKPLSADQLTNCLAELLRR